jgi:hypothetical protein
MKSVGCPVCAAPLRFSPAQSRKAKKPKLFLMLACPTDGRHFRGFINDMTFVEQFISASRLSASNGAAGSTGTGTGTSR